MLSTHVFHLKKICGDVMRNNIVVASCAHCKLPVLSHICHGFLGCPPIQHSGRALLRLLSLVGNIGWIL